MASLDRPDDHAEAAAVMEAVRLRISKRAAADAQAQVVLDFA